jgi:hypothetical protein
MSKKNLVFVKGILLSLAFAIAGVWVLVDYRPPVKATPMVEELPDASSPEPTEVKVELMAMESLPELIKASEPERLKLWMMDEYYPEPTAEEPKPAEGEPVEGEETKVTPASTEKPKESAKAEAPKQETVAETPMTADELLPLEEPQPQPQQQPVYQEQVVEKTTAPAQTVVVSVSAQEEVVVYYEQPPRREMLVGVSRSTLRSSMFWYDNSWWGYNAPLETYVMLTDNSFLGRCSYNVGGHRNWGLGNGGHGGGYRHSEFSGRSADSYSPAITIVEHSHRGSGSYRGGGRGGKWNRTDSVRPPARTEHRVINTSTGNHRSREVTGVRSVGHGSRRLERVVNTGRGGRQNFERTPVRTERVVRTLTENRRSEVAGVRQNNHGPTRRSERAVHRNPVAENRPRYVSGRDNVGQVVKPARRVERPPAGQNVQRARSDVRPQQVVQRGGHSGQRVAQRSTSAQVRRR